MKTVLFLKLISTISVYLIFTCQQSLAVDLCSSAPAFLENKTYSYELKTFDTPKDSETSLRNELLAENLGGKPGNQTHNLPVLQFEYESSVLAPPAPGHRYIYVGKGHSMDWQMFVNRYQYLSDSMIKAAYYSTEAGAVYVFQIPERLFSEDSIDIRDERQDLDYTIAHRITAELGTLEGYDNGSISLLDCCFVGKIPGEEVKILNDYSPSFPLKLESKNMETNLELSEKQIYDLKLPLLRPTTYRFKPRDSSK